ncbi:kdo(2)-lipid A phosphoethanolamine 7''-transferase [Pantoea rodasii]|uniref:Kdo(2)-lipid A phosphoethanolamine 7''-transferase n=1 Tax=Pantoea rodasii TaxID=1076549 RepID=A0A2M9W5Y7_9GAMM|nr:kdo(2)-lipid A phosphoethanolamine 7''-transferase [Pantoea rodasii]ORM65359.1 lipid A phosphoethanolamine transferase [Pantoea rodasii]PJZ02919.1 kdo(2)-lipid A phosphoethanolamine 7''-transferase [Pantoea rodasii]
MFKRSFLRQLYVPIFIALFVGILLNLPIFFRRFEKISFDRTLSLIVEVFAAFCLVLFLCMLLSLLGKYVSRIGMSALVLVSSAASYYMIFYNIDIGYGIVAAVMAADSFDLSKESVGWHFFVWLIAINSVPLFVIWKYHDRQKHSSMQPKFAWSYKTLVMIIAGLGCWLPLNLMGKVQAEQDKVNNRMMASYGGVVAGTYSPSNWLSGVGLLAYSTFSQAEDDRNLYDPAEHFKYVAPKSADDLYIVFVIGESARRDHMGLYGYARDNTPYLDQEKNLIHLQGYSCDTSTKLSLRCMFVREGGASEAPERTLKEMNVFTVMKKQGFSSELFSMQSEAWFYNKVLADSYSVRESIQAEKRHAGQPVDDMALIDELKDSIDRHPQGKHIVILHTKGSHYMYTERYPRAFARYKPECQGIDDACSTEEMVNSYDNSLLYTDYFLKKTFDSLKDKNAIVFYASDHGESISDNLHFHGTPRDHAPMAQRTIPIMVWASDKFLSNKDNQLSFDRLRELQDKKTPVFHEKLFDSILGCSGFTSPDGGINKYRNWCNHVS